MTQEEKFEQGVRSTSITLKICTDYNVKDMSDYMRVNMLAMEIARNEHTVDSLKKSSGFLSTTYDFNFTDEYLQKLIDFKIESYEKV